MLYDRACRDCLYCVEDVIEHFSEAAIKDCPNCGRKTLARLQPISHFQIAGFSYNNKYEKSK